MMSASRRYQLIIVIASLFLGVMIDFLFNGVLKIVWFAIYGVVYLTCASTLYSYLHLKFGNHFAVRAGGVLLLGCLIGHLAFVGRREIRTYSMNLTSSSSIILQTPELAQTLYVTGDHVLQAVGKTSVGQTIPVTIQVIKDYGCIYSFKVASVAGVDVMNDPTSTWVWRQEDSRTPPSGGFAGLSEENAHRFWCLIQWF